LITDVLLLAGSSERDLPGKPADPHARLEKWLGELQWLWATLEAWIQPATNGDIATWALGNGVEIYEEALGHYQAQTYELAVGSHTLTFRPVGSMVAGSRGRVDVVSGSRSAMLLLLDGEHEWMTGMTGPRAEMKPLTEETFASLLSLLLT
jgi:hypothetical protein